MTDALLSFDRKEKCNTLIGVRFCKVRAAHLVDKDVIFVVF